MNWPNILFRNRFALYAILLVFISMTGCKTNQTIPNDNQSAEGVLPSWNDEAARQEIIGFVSNTTWEGSAQYIPREDRIAVFDNDGTLWSEQPFYFQLAFAIDRVKSMAAQHPEWKQQEPFASLLKGDLNKVMEGGEKSLMQIIASTHAGMSGEAFAQQVKQWTDTARHPVTGRRYVGMVYKPMLELLEYLRANGYTTYIVSGGGIDFMRPWVESVYGIPPAQVVGSSMKVRYEEKDGDPLVIKLPELDFVDDGPGKPVGIYRHIGKRPVLAVGNSDGDYEMLKYTTSTNTFSTLGIIIHHTDKEREYAYDSLSHIGRLKRGLTDAAQNNWLIVDMKKDWSAIYPE